MSALAPDRFAKAVRRALRLLGPPSRVLVAVSGGADSMALVHALATARRGPIVIAGHVDHRLREDSHLDRALVEDTATRLGVPVDTRLVSVVETGAGLEEAAREVRYAALVELARTHGCRAIVTGHTATDQAETLLLRLLRGSGTRGLGAIAPERPLDELRVLRPMLDFTREATRAYCEALAVPFRDDPTNVDDRPRATLRKAVLPILERLQPGAAERLAKATERLRADETYLASIADEAAGRVGRDAAAISALPEPIRRRVLAGWASAQSGSPRRLTANHLEALERLVLSGRGEVVLPEQGGRLLLARVVDGRLACDAMGRAPGRGAGALKRPTRR